MSATDDVKYQQSLMRRKVGESDESFARRLFAMQVEVYSANAGTDLDQDREGQPGLRFDTLDAETRSGWIESAKRHTQTHGCEA